MCIKEITSVADIEKYSQNNLLVIHFYASWSEECQHMSGLFQEMSNQNKFSSIIFAKCIAEDLPEISMGYKVSAVPTFIFVKNSKLVDRVDGADPDNLDKKLEKQLNAVNGFPIPSQPVESLDDRLKKLVNKHPVMIFMKGDRNQPRCGFSKTIIELINETKVPYETFDILQDDEVRQGLKTFSNWPTYPQLYVKGELVGGLDIVKEIKAAGELEQTLNPKD